jgi:hypothetical protein
LCLSLSRTGEKELRNFAILLKFSSSGSKKKLQSGFTVARAGKNKFSRVYLLPWTLTMTIAERVSSYVHAREHAAEIFLINQQWTRRRLLTAHSSLD